LWVTIIDLLMLGCKDKMMEAMNSIMKALDHVAVAFVICFLLLGIPFLTGMLLRILLKRPSAMFVAFLAAFLFFVAGGTPENLPSGFGRLPAGFMNSTGNGAFLILELSIVLIIGIGLPFLFARWGTMVVDRRRKKP